MDLKQETLITIPEAARLVPPRGVHVATAWRWALSGLADGRKLETVKIGGRTYTSEQALLERFLAVDAGRMPVVDARQRKRQIEAAEKELADYGV